MSYGNYGGGTRNVDMSKTEADLAINIRKATSIGEQLQKQRIFVARSAMKTNCMFQRKLHPSESMSEHVSSIPGTTSPPTLSGPE